MSFEFEFKIWTQTQLTWTQVVLIYFLLKHITKCGKAGNCMIQYNTMYVTLVYMITEEASEHL